MKLFEVPRNTDVRLISGLEVPPGAPILEEGEIVHFCTTDGMYSYCLRENYPVYVASWAEVEIVNNTAF